SQVTVNDDNFGRYEFYNADSDNLIQEVDGGEVFDLNNIGENLNFRAIPYGGDGNPEVESVQVNWTGVENGNHSENVPIYAGLTGHLGNDFEPYTVSEGTYEFTVTYYSEDQASGNVVGEDTFTLTFTRGEQVDAGEDQAICFGDTTTLTATGADTYLWSTGETTASIEVSPNNTVTYTVIGDHSNGNFTEDTVTVSVNESTEVSAGADQSICEGDSITLTATATGGEILWSNGATTNSITESPNSTTTYTVTADNNGCASSDDVTVTVSELPSADAGNDVAILNGENVTLTASGGGTYLWSTGETTQNIEVSPTTDQVYTVTVTNASSCTDEDSVQVSVIEPIVAEAGEDSTICEGESLTLNASGGDNYLWSTGETTQSITVNPDNTTVYTVTVSDAYSSDSDTVTVTVNPVPIADAGDDVTIDQGESVTLYGSGGNSYIWSTGETNANISVSPTETTTYRLTAIINGCSSEAEVTVTVLAPVNADAGEDVTICNSESVTLTASGGNEFEWSNGETSQSIEVSPSETTVYSVRVSNSLGFAIDEVQVTVNECSLSGPTEEANGFEFKAFPNPTNGLLNLKISALDQDAIVYVTDIIGKRVRTIEVGAAVNQVTRREINLSGMPPGFYILNLSTENRSITKKIILR
ncbi:MAG: T9SS type A sorting domain-containing protein, partial [Bacteroidia bacterium]|nr:T9SS type A sorting domain-containing protein [Bacteroidia bacterium]